MLTYENLVDYAKERGMPQEKTRGILREYLQILILKILFSDRNSNTFSFTGGTYLRLANLTKRFSEDLDFYSVKLNMDAFQVSINRIAGELQKYNIKTKLDFDKRENLFTAGIHFTDIEEAYGLSGSRRGVIVIKFETAVPEWKINNSQRVINGYGETFIANCLDESILMADKIDAIHKKPRGRHIYDIIYLLSKKTEPDKKVLKGYGYKEVWCEVLLKRFNEFTDSELKKFADQLGPFLFDEDEKNKIIDAKKIVSALVSQNS
ncbi:MAG: nucleotidyl transferase AbiEii/AbiGii toxin family protein [bacterium]